MPETLDTLLARRGNLCSAEGIVELRKLIAFNDANPTQRFGYRAACALLESYGVKVGRDGLNKICQREFKRDY